MKCTEVKENVDLQFSPAFEISESEKTSEGWLKIGGIALAEGKSKNGISYRYENIRENDGKEFKWLVGHPEEPESHVVGKGKFFMREGKLYHEGVIRNTATHPDIVEGVRDGFYGPSIHASASKLIRKEGEMVVEGLDIGGVGLVAFQGVRDASIEYAIAESFRPDMKESDESDVNKNNDNKGDNMSEDQKSEPAAQDPAKEEPKQEEPAQEEPKKEDEPQQEEKVQEMEKRLSILETERKAKIVESILNLNKELKKEDLLKESEEKLELIKEYEEKLSKKQSPTGDAVVETDASSSKAKILEKEGNFSLSESAYKEFQNEIRARVR